MRVMVVAALVVMATGAHSQGFYGSHEDYYSGAYTAASAAAAAQGARAAQAPQPAAPPQRGGWSWFGGQQRTVAAAAEPVYQQPAGYAPTRSWMPSATPMDNTHVRPEDYYGRYYPRYSHLVVRDDAAPGELSTATPIEIWLSERRGRFGPHTFAALGGTRKDPTPIGRFRAVKKQEDYVSRKFQTDMPYAVFFTQACAIHVGSLSEPSHGCIHVDWAIGELMYRYAKPGRTPIIIHP